MLKKVQFPSKLQCLFNKLVRYIILWGGRGGAKSWGVARALLIRGTENPLRILCAREIQRSIAESVHQLLRDQIIELGLSDFYKVTNSEITGQNGTVFMFAGLKHNISEIKSKEGIDIVWVEEAEKVSKNSWDTLIPTIRKEGSQIIATFNVDIEESETYQRLVVNPPKNSVIEKLTYRDNPWFPHVLELERLDLLERDPIAYNNVWEGNPKAAIEGAIFAKELQMATEQGRITSVPYDPIKPVDTFWDLGRSNLTAIWFVQYVGMQYRVLRHYSNHLQDMSHYLKVVKDLPYVYGTHYLPHDAEHERLGMDRSIEVQARDILGNVQIVPRVAHKINAIEAAKAIFPLCWFDRELCAEGISDLRRYAYAMDIQTGKIGKEPDHNIYSDTADAFQCFAMAIDQQNAPPRPMRQQCAMMDLPNYSSAYDV